MRDGRLLLLLLLLVTWGRGGGVRLRGGEPGVELRDGARWVQVAPAQALVLEELVCAGVLGAAGWCDCVFLC